MKDSTKRFALGTIFAAAAGYIAGILTAPKSGKETRQDIKEVAQHTMVEAEKKLKELHTELAELLAQAKAVATTLTGNAKKQLDEAIKAGQAVKEKTRESLSAAHEGAAQDEDLQTAIAEANSAVKHLKKFLKNSKP